MAISRFSMARPMAARASLNSRQSGSCQSSSGRRASVLRGRFLFGLVCSSDADCDCKARRYRSILCRKYALSPLGRTHHLLSGLARINNHCRIRYTSMAGRRNSVSFSPSMQCIPKRQRYLLQMQISFLL